MPLVEPEPFQEALDKLARRIPTGRPWDSSTWAEQALDVRERAFFSAKVENVFFLKRAKLFLQNFLERQRDEDGALTAGSMSVFVEEMRAFAIQEGMNTKRLGLPDVVNEGDITDIRSETRLRLIFRTNVATSYGYGSWRQGMEPIVLEAFPAARVVRNPGAKTKRPRHEMEEGNVRLKTDTDYWAGYMNAREIGGFQTPWPPYGFNSFIDQADVSRADAERLQLVEKEKPVKGSKRKKATLNERLRVSLAGLNKAERERLKAEMGALAVLGPKAVRFAQRHERAA
jgi:hypothetical protein